TTLGHTPQETPDPRVVQIVLAVDPTSGPSGDEVEGTTKPQFLRYVHEPVESIVWVEFVTASHTGRERHELCCGLVVPCSQSTAKSRPQYSQQTIARGPGPVHVVADEQSRLLGSTLEARPQTAQARPQHFGELVHDRAV